MFNSIRAPLNYLYDQSNDAVKSHDACAFGRQSRNRCTDYETGTNTVHGDYPPISRPPTYPPIQDHTYLEFPGSHRHDKLKPDTSPGERRLG